MRTDDPDQRFAAGSVLATDPADRGPLTVAAVALALGAAAGQVRRATRTGTAAEELRDTLLLTIDSADLAPLADPEEFYDHDLIGLQVATVAGEQVGAVTDVLHHGQDSARGRRAADRVRVLRS